MSKSELPKMGDGIPVAKFHVSKCNIRADQPFGEAEEDRQLIENLRRGKIIGPFKARLEGDGYGVFVGRRRFLAKKMVGAKNFVVGVDCLIEDVNEEEAREASLIENLAILRRDMDPITRAKRLDEIIASSPLGLRATARRLGLKPSTLSEWLKPLELSDKMQEVTAKQNIFFTDALQIAKMKLGAKRQDELAEILETDGYEAFKREVERLLVGKGKRGIPKGVYEIDRVVWDKRNRKEVGYYETLMRAAEAKKMKVPEYIKDFIIRHIDEIAKEIANP